ncbi:MAG: hypothetical protein ACQESB_00605 [Elusimicrobiota bacterium]
MEEKGIYIGSKMVKSVKIISSISILLLLSSTICLARIERVPLTTERNLIGEAYRGRSWKSPSEAGERSVGEGIIAESFSEIESEEKIDEEIYEPEPGDELLLNFFRFAEDRMILSKIKKIMAETYTALLSLVSRNSQSTSPADEYTRPLMRFLKKTAVAIDNIMTSIEALVPPLFRSSDNTFPTPLEQSSLSEEEIAEYRLIVENIQAPSEVTEFLSGDMDGRGIEYVASTYRSVFGNPMELFFHREAVCTGYARFSREALENMPEGTEPYETVLMVENYTDFMTPHAMLAYREPDTGRWGYLDMYTDYSPDIIEEAGINPNSREAIVEYMANTFDNRAQVTFLNDNTLRIFDESYTINEDNSYRRENFIQRLFSRI